jgi:Zn-dependent protease/CBS domain-containing protein
MDRDLGSGPRADLKEAAPIAPLSGSWKLCRIAGIPVYVHWTFLILLAWVFFGHVMAGQDLPTSLRGVVFVLAIFGCVVLHEMGHALTARRFGVPTSDITLLPIGGVARLREIPDKPAQELLIAIAGPAVNLLLVLALYLAGVRVPRATSDAQLLFRGGLLPSLLFVNLFLMLFNLLPAFPMDGGRVLRALLAMAMDYGRATQIAARIGRLMAVLFGLLGLSAGNPMLVLIAIFVWLGAEAEAMQVQERWLLRAAHVRDAMRTEFHILSPFQSLSEAAELLIAGPQRAFPVVENRRVLGVLTHDAVVSGLMRAGGDARIGELDLAPAPTVGADTPLLPALGRLRESGAPCLLVQDRDETAGLLTSESVGEYVLIQTARSAGPHSESETAPSGALLEQR